MKKLFGILMAVLVAGALATGCGGDEKKKKPVYPACATNDDCAEHGEYCADKTCVECTKGKHCKKKGPCLGCKNGKCE